MTEKVFLMELSIDDGEYAFTSVHRTHGGAVAALTAKAAELDAADELEIARYDEQRYEWRPGASTLYGETDGLSFGISWVEVKP